MLALWILAGTAHALLASSVGGADSYVVDLQNILREERVYYGEINGVADERTIAAIRHYQILHGLRVTGRLDDATLAVMHLPAPAPHPQVISEDRRFLERLGATAGPTPRPGANGVGKHAARPSPKKEPPPVTPVINTAADPDAAGENRGPDDQIVREPKALDATSDRHQPHHVKTKRGGRNPDASSSGLHFRRDRNRRW